MPVASKVSRRDDLEQIAADYDADVAPLLGWRRELVRLGRALAEKQAGLGARRKISNNGRVVRVPNRRPRYLLAFL